MMLRSVTKWLLGLAVVCGVVMLGAGNAEAHLFGHHGGSCGSCGSCGSWGGSYGSYGSYGSCGGSWGSYGSYGSWGSYGCCGYSYSSCGCCGSAVPAATIVPSTPMTPPPPGADGKTTYNPSVASDSALLAVSVPADAKVFVNGRATTSVGAQRQYVSRGLETGMRYAYEVRAEMTRDGKTVSETRTVELTAGTSANVSFENAATQTVQKKTASPRTAVLLHVPADAKVFLAGQETKSSGATREFSTARLTDGQRWDNYTVRVISGGQTQEKTISLTAGESRDLTFDFSAAKVASAR